LAIIEHKPYRIGGFTYLDVLHVYGISRAGFVPQMFSLRLSNPEIIFELLKKANAQALIYDTSVQADLSTSPVPTRLAIDARTADVTTGDLPNMPTIRGSDTAIIFHTSGSTSGSPKLVPCNYSWLNFVIGKDDQTTIPLDSGKQMVGIW
jgi:acyl-CoA synthetase (AMP-forming)/AMP-acid ligase II